MIRAMRRIVLGISAIGVSLGLSVQPALVSAQVQAIPLNEDYTNIENTEEQEVRSRRAYADFARCLVQRNRQAVEEFLALEPWSEEASNRLADLLDNDHRRCRMDEWIVMPTTLSRGAMFDALYAEDFASVPIPDITDIRISSDTARVSAQQNDSVSTTTNFARGAVINSTSGGEMHAATINFRRFTNCVVRQEPTWTRFLVQTQAASDEESRAFEMLQPSLGVCLASGEFTITRDQLRNFLSESLYRLTEAALLDAGTTEEEPDA